MATQVAMLANTIVGMKKAVKRKAYDSDSDSSIEQPTNRGNKLLKKARFVREGQLAPANGHLLYKRSIVHAGFEREIISVNPPLLDEDGYELDSDDDEELVEDAIAEAAEVDPYSRISIEQLLAPLTSAADLPNHPTLSKPFTSNTLTELTRQAGEMVQKEKESLWKIKHLLTRMSGDNTWIPCGITETEDDFELFLDERNRHQAQFQPKTARKDRHERGATPVVTVNAKDQPVGLVTTEARTTDDLGVEQTRIVQMLVEDNDDSTTASAIIPVEGTNGDHKSRINGASRDRENVVVTDTSPAEQTTNDSVIPENGQSTDDQPGDEAEGEDETGVAIPRRMRTRAQAQAASDSTPMRTRSATPDSNEDSYIHPYFLASQTSRPDRDLYLPTTEADECRRLLQLYIQKQEEVCRGAQRVYEGLLRAERHRKEVFKWCKAEAHVGLGRDMSDGEDWYDKDEWGLEDDLKKGQDEEEEDATTTAKKTRARRQ